MPQRRSNHTCNIASKWRSQEVKLDLHSFHNAKELDCIELESILGEH